MPTPDNLSKVGYADDIIRRTQRADSGAFMSIEAETAKNEFSG